MICITCLRRPQNVSWKTPDERPGSTCCPESDAKFKAIALAEEGYKPAGEVIACPLCGEKYILLFECGTGSGMETPSAALYEKTLKYFRERITESHQGGHQYDRLAKAR